MCAMRQKSRFDVARLKIAFSLLFRIWLVDSDKQQPLDLLASSDCLSATTSANLHGFNLFNDTIGGQNLKFGSLNGICP
jgi:hypothetical protein